MKDRSLFNKKDLFILPGVLVVAFLLIWARGLPAESGGLVCEITLMGGGATEIVDLDKDGRFSLFGLDGVVFEVRDHKIAFAASDCADKTCVHTGFVGRAGQVAVCLPNKIVVRLYSQKSGPEPLDAIAR